MLAYGYVALGGALGSILRFGMNRWLTLLLGDGLPWGTILINIGGSFVIVCARPSSRTGRVLPPAGSPPVCAGRPLRRLHHFFVLQPPDPDPATCGRTRAGTAQCHAVPCPVPRRSGCRLHAARFHRHLVQKRRGLNSPTRNCRTHPMSPRILIVGGSMGGLFAAVLLTAPASKSPLPNAPNTGWRGGAPASWPSARCSTSCGRWHRACGAGRRDRT